MRTGDDGVHPTFCRLCEAFCGLSVTVSNGRIVKTTSDRDNPHSHGHVCIKGTSFDEVVNDPDRILHPLKRVGGPGEFERVGWDEALGDIATRLNAIISESGPDAFAAYFGNPGAFSSDSVFSAQWFLHHLGGHKFYTAGSQDSNSRHLACYLLYGVAFRNAFPDLPNCDMLVIAGANPLISHGGLLTAPRMRQDLDAIAERGEVVVLDPRLTETAARYSHIPIRPDTDAWQLASMLRILFDEGLADLDFLEANTTGWRNLRDAVCAVDLELAAEITGVPLETTTKLVRRFVGTERAAMYGRVGLCRGSFSTITNFMVDAVNIVAGKFGRIGGSTFGAFPLQGGKDPHSGYATHHTRIGHLPTVGGMMATAVLADDIMEPGEGQVRAMMIVAGNPVLSGPGGERLEQALASLDLFFSCDLYLTETNRYADYILPSATFLEKPDVPMIGISHMVRPFMQFSPAVIAPMGESREDSAIFGEISERMGLGQISPVPGISRPVDALDAAFRMGPLGDQMGNAEGLSFEQLAEEHPHGLMLPLPLTYGDWASRIETPDGRLRLWHDIVSDEFDRFRAQQNTAADSRLRLFSQRHLKSMNSWLHNVPRLARGQHPALLIHPADAEKRGILTGETVRISSDTASLDVIAEVSESVIAGAVCYPHGWGHKGGWSSANELQGRNINVLLGRGPGAAEAVSGTTFIDGLPVDVERLEPAIQER